MNIKLFALLIAVLSVAGLVRVVMTSRRLPTNRVRSMRVRLHLRLRPGRGHATWLGLWLRWGRAAIFRKSRHCRPSLSAWQRLRHPSWCSVLLGRAQRRHRLHVTLEEHVLVMAPPRQHKTAWLAKVVLRYRGPVVSTSTKPDVFGLTSGVRSRIGPVEVFNPQFIGGVPSTFAWNPISGCRDIATAIRRADGFAHAVSTEGTDDGNFWTASASSALRAMFHAAALVDGDLRLVARWALGNAEQAEEILARAVARQLAADLAQLRSEAQKTAATIRMVIARALSFLADPALAACVLPADDPFSGFDIAAFLRDTGTLYLIAESQHDDSPVAPLFACLAGEIRYQAAMIGQASPGGRLDPPLLMALDEIVQTCPVPLPTWLADSGGKGVQIISVAHGEGQLRTRWGDDGAQAILDTSGVKVFLPGITDPRTLAMASDLCGDTAYQERGQEHDTRHPVMTPDMVRQLPPMFALVIRGGLSPVVVRIGMAWKDRLYRSARRSGAAVAVITAARLAVPGPAEVPVIPAGALLPDLVPAARQADPEAADGEIFAGADTTSYPWR